MLYLGALWTWFSCEMDVTKKSVLFFYPFSVWKLNFHRKQMTLTNIASIETAALIIKVGCSGMQLCWFECAFFYFILFCTWVSLITLEDIRLISISIDFVVHFFSFCYLNNKGSVSFRSLREHYFRVSCHWATVDIGSRWGYAQAISVVFRVYVGWLVALKFRYTRKTLLTQQVSCLFCMQSAE